MIKQSGAGKKKSISFVGSGVNGRQSERKICLVMHWCKAAPQKRLKISPKERTQFCFCCIRRPPSVAVTVRSWGPTPRPEEMQFSKIGDHMVCVAGFGPEQVKHCQVYAVGYRLSIDWFFRIIFQNSVATKRFSMVQGPGKQPALLFEMRFLGTKKKCVYYFRTKMFSKPSC